MESKLRLRVLDSTSTRVPFKIPRGLSGKINTLAKWRITLKHVTEEFYKRFWFYHPVKCAPGVFARRPKVRGLKETYTCPGGPTHSFMRFRYPKNFFKYKYGRGGEFAQSLFAILKKLGVRCRLILGYWSGSDALWVHAFNPWTKRWISLDPAYKHGYGHWFPKKNMKGVIALEEANGPIKVLKKLLSKM